MAGVKKSRWVYVRVTEAMFEKLSRRSSRDGLTLPEYVRVLISKDQGVKVYQSKEVYDAKETEGG